MGKKFTKQPTVSLRGVALILFGFLVPPLLFPDENQFLVGLLGVPAFLLGVIFLLIAASKRQNRDEPPSDDDKAA